jgi:hypothetical protein
MLSILYALRSRPVQNANGGRDGHAATESISPALRERLQHELEQLVHSVVEVLVRDHRESLMVNPQILRVTRDYLGRLDGGAELAARIPQDVV